MTGNERVLIGMIFVVSLGLGGVIGMLSIEVKTLNDNLIKTESQLLLCQESGKLCAEMYNEVIEN